MSEFTRGLSDKFRDALRAAYQQGGWWKGIVDDREMFIAPRMERVRAYYRGNCLLKVRLHGGQLVGKVHYKYVLNPDLKPAYWDVEDGQVDRPGGVNPFITDFSNLDLIKRASKPYVGEEKYGVSEIIAANPNIIDVEIAFGGSANVIGDDDEPLPPIDGRERGGSPRIDFVAVQKDGDTDKLVFFEAKHFSNKELRSSTDKPPVVEQIERYAELLNQNEKRVLNAYRVHCADILKSDCIRGDSERREFLTKVAGDPSVKLDRNPRLVVFGFDADQKPGEVWKKHKEKLEKHLGHRVLFRGSAKGPWSDICTTKALLGFPQATPGIHD